MTPTYTVIEFKKSFRYYSIKQGGLILVKSLGFAAPRRANSTRLVWFWTSN